jgi:hypothetical protein
MDQEGAMNCDREGRRHTPPRTGCNSLECVENQALLVGKFAWKRPVGDLIPGSPQLLRSRFHMAFDSLAPARSVLSAPLPLADSFCCFPGDSSLPSFCPRLL